MCNNGQNQVEVTPDMVNAAITALRDSGRFEHPGLIDATFVAEVIRVALAAKK